MTYVHALLGWYLDLLLYLTISTLVRHLLVPILEWPLWADLLVFLVFRGTSMFLVTTPGQWLLAPAAAERSSTTASPPRQWTNLLLGTVFFLEGTKRMVRWLEMDHPLPFLGYVPESGLTQGAVGIAMGVLLVVAGGALLRLEPLGRLLGLLTVALMAISTVLSWTQWDALVERLVVARRMAQGIPVRSGEIEFMQSLLPEGIAVALVVVTGLLLLCRGRYGA